MTGIQRGSVFALIAILLGETVAPTVAYALTTGPSQPEVQGFQPANANDLVNLFSGDFSYNIPLLDVEGYPVNLFYNAGIGVDQEASWVGLGWNLTPGVVERNLRGIPDDFKGDEITRTVKQRPNRTAGAGYSHTWELFGLTAPGEAVGDPDVPDGNPNNGEGLLTTTLSTSFNSYEGMSVESGISTAMKSAVVNKSRFNIGLGLTSHSKRGLRMQHEYGFGKDIGSNYRAGLNFGTVIDSRSGLTEATFGLNLSRSHWYDANGKNSDNDEENPVKGYYGGGTKSTFDIGPSTYLPAIEVPMQNSSLSFSFAFGLEVSGTFSPNRIHGFYSSQKPRTENISRNAYGYLHLGSGVSQADNQLDFNREKDGAYSPDRAALGIASLTHDVFTVSGQGISGSYRAFRADVGHVYDPYNSSTGWGVSGGYEVGGGALVHTGVDVMVNISNSHSGDWSSSNEAGANLAFRKDPTSPNLEMVFFREANEPTLERDSSQWVSMQGSEAMGFQMTPSGPNATLNSSLTASWNTSTGDPISSVNYRQKREARAQLFTYLNREQAESFGVQAPEPSIVEETVEINGVDIDINYQKDHHLSEITILGENGQRYVYGQPVYNFVQHDVEFSVDTDPVDGIVDYSAEEASTGNNAGREEYFSKTTTPPYPYAFLLTSLLSADYSDIDLTRGPSSGDLGNYTTFTYHSGTPTNANPEPSLDHVPWRTPVVAYPSNAAYGRARFMRGRTADKMDDKATYVYGEKQIRYLHEIETRNMVAVFTTAPRLDALPVLETGYAITSPELLQQQLNRIDLYSKGTTEDGVEIRTLIKSVHFEYNIDADGAPFTLCPGTPNSTLPSGGKLTLSKVWFTYGTSGRGVTSPYVFTYGLNPSYDSASQDRWGVYKLNIWSGLPNEDFPYAEQNPATADLNSSAWNLRTIHQPSGGLITVDYESDDYAYVQDRRAMRMFKLSTGEVALALDEDDLPYIDYYKVYLNSSNSINTEDERLRAVEDIRNLYFRFLYQMKDEPSSTSHAYVSGYCDLVNTAETDPPVQTDVQIGQDVNGVWVGIEPVYLDGVVGDIQNPPSGGSAFPPRRAALEHMQVNYPQLAHNVAVGLDDEENELNPLLFFPSLLNSMVGLFAIGSFINGPNNALPNKCTQVDYTKSWIRLNEPDARKMGGGHRVSQITYSDSWANMETNEQDETSSYGQTYTYRDEAGSYGVASYEPMSGADENPFRQPVFGRKDNTMAPDERFYQEEPFGESMFPGGSVGYSKVIVKDIHPGNGLEAQQGTGSVIHEFYTARDFPTRTSKTILKPVPKKNKVNLLSLLGFRHFDHMHASQGFTVETNDMHGKPKSVSVYPVDAEEPISSVRYIYNTTSPDGQGRLRNLATTIDEQGNIGQAEIGRQYEFVADTREFMSTNTTGGLQLNMDLVILAGWPGIYPKFSSETTRFKTGVLVKKIHRAGLLQKIVKLENGSNVITENMAYDANTGAVLLTKTNNDFEDPIYSMQFPAYWHYDGMGPAYRNIGNHHSALELDLSGIANFPNAPGWFSPGDELAMVPNSGGDPVRGWVNEVMADGIKVINKVGQPINGNYSIDIIRSGRRNLQAQRMMTLATYSNPLDGMAANIYANIVNVAAMEYSAEWDTDCQCAPATGPGNPWVRNEKGVWRLEKERAWLSDRTRTVVNRNTNVRHDGLYASFDPLFKNQNGQWVLDPAGWTTVRQVNQYGPRGQELENRDALGLYTSAIFGHSGTLPIGVARNARYRETGFTSFEDAAMDDCADGHFTFNDPTIVEGIAHTGRRSILVTSSSSATLNHWKWNCGCDFQLEIVEGSGSQRYVVAREAHPPVTFTIHADNESACPLTPLSPLDPVWMSVPSLVSLNLPQPRYGAGFACEENASTYIIAEDANGCRAYQSLTW